MFNIFFFLNQSLLFLRVGSNYVCTSLSYDPSDFVLKSNTVHCIIIFANCIENTLFRLLNLFIIN
jgi:hypothetical protein